MFSISWDKKTLCKKKGRSLINLFWSSERKFSLLCFHWVTDWNTFYTGHRFSHTLFWNLNTYCFTCNLLITCTCRTSALQLTTVFTKGFRKKNRPEMLKCSGHVMNVNNQSQKFDHFFFVLRLNYLLVSFVIHFSSTYFSSSAQRHQCHSGFSSNIALSGHRLSIANASMAKRWPTCGY